MRRGWAASPQIAVKFAEQPQPVRPRLLGVELHAVDAAPAPRRVTNSLP